MNKYYCEQLRNFRKNIKNNNTQEKFSESIQLSLDFYEKIEIGKSNPSLLSHIAICLQLDKPSDCFFNKNMPDVVLSREKLDYLKSLEPEQLMLISEILQLIYNRNNNLNKD